MIKCKPATIGCVVQISLAACNVGDNLPTCRVDMDEQYVFAVDEPPFICSQARYLSARDSATLLVSPATLRRYHDRLLLAINAEPYFAGFSVGGRVLRSRMVSTQPAVWDVWNRGRLTPVSADVDIALNGIGATPTQAPQQHNYSDGTHFVTMDFDAQRLFSPQALNDVLATAGLSLEETPAELNPADTTFLWPPDVAPEGDDGATVQIDAAIIEKTDGTVVGAPHFLRAIVTPISAVVYDMSGAPLSDRVPPLRATTRPWR